MTLGLEKVVIDKEKVIVGLEIDDAEQENAVMGLV